MSTLPSDGLEGLKRHWRSDLSSGFLVFLIALPLCLGISLAAGAPPISGVFTAIIGGMLSTFLGGAHLTIKGPAAGLIVIILGAITELGAGDPVQGYRQMLAVGVVSGWIQIGFALARAGRLGDFFPSSVVHGMLAAIGIIIMSKQLHTVLGVKPQGHEALELIAELPRSLEAMNPVIAVIGFVSLVIMFGMPWIRHPLARKVPAQLIVLLTAIPLGMFLGLGTEHTVTWGGSEHVVGPKFLVSLPPSLIGAITFPDFSAVTSAVSIKYIVMFSLVGTIESLLSSKAVDMLDPWHRRSDLDRDLLAVGVANTAAAMVGGLPMISEIVRSSANVAAGAHTRWSNFFHGVFLLAFMAFLPGLLQLIPLAALAAMLVFTGSRLASPSEFQKTWSIGSDQLAVFLTTIFFTLATDLLIGVGAGMLLKVVIQVSNGLPIRSVFRPDMQVTEDSDATVITVQGAATFTNYLAIKGTMERLRDRKRVIIDLSGTNLVDHTVLEKLHEMEHELAHEGRELVVRGLDGHRALSGHPLAARKRKHVA
jgi:MFS superfamily sulfate permease-like transporter